MIKIVHKSFMRLKAVHDAANETARKAKADMEANEAKWNLVEQLLHMKRNEYGALVPIRTVDENIS